MSYSSSLPFGGSVEDQRGLLQQAQDITFSLNHPVAAAFHLLFKLLAIFLYLFGGALSSNFVNIFVLCVLMLAFDFWTVKNVSGRLLVGLRWCGAARLSGGETCRMGSKLCHAFGQPTFPSSLFHCPNLVRRG